MAPRKQKKPESKKHSNDAEKRPAKEKKQSAVEEEKSNENEKKIGDASKPVLSSNQPEIEGSDQTNGKAPQENLQVEETSKPDLLFSPGHEKDNAKPDDAVKEKSFEKNPPTVQDDVAESYPLQDKLVFWFTRRQKGNNPVRTQADYEDNIKKMFEFSTVEGFWDCYCHLIRPSSLPNPTDLHLFKSGIRPLWEDEANRNGGKWIVRFKKGVVDRYWEDIILAFVGNRLETSENVCGAVLSVRFSEDIISIWNRTTDEEVVSSLKGSIKKHLQLPPTYIMEYKPHDAALKDHSSFRNTWVRT